MFSTPFLTILFHHWIWWTILRLGCLTGQARVIVWTMNAMVPSVFGNLLEGTMIILFRQLSKASSRDYDHLNCFVLPKNSTCKHGPFWKATSGITLGVKVWIVYWLSCICLCIRLSSVWFYLHTNPRSKHGIIESDKLREFKVYAITNKYPGMGVQIFTNGDETLIGE